VGLANLGSKSETCVGSCVHHDGASISFEKNFYRLPFTPPSLVCRIRPSVLQGGGLEATSPSVFLGDVRRLGLDEKLEARKLA
jgi:hypothetical protein